MGHLNPCSAFPRQSLRDGHGKHLPTYEPGFVEWTINPNERLFVEGDGVEDAVLQRGQTDSAVGGFTVGVTNGPVPVFTLQSPPVEQPVEAQVFMSVYFSVILEGGGGPQSCALNMDGLVDHAVLLRQRGRQRNLQHICEPSG